MAFRRIVALSAVATALGDQASPLGKAVELLGSLQTKIIQEGEDSQKVYNEFSEWCEGRSRELGHEIKTGKGEVAELKAVIGQQSATVESLTTKVETLTGDISADEADLKAAVELRHKEQGLFAKEEKELVEVVGTLERAIAILEREMKGGASMMQLSAASDVSDALKVLVEASKLSTADSDRLTALVQSSDDDTGAPAAAVYKSHSGGIIETLSDLLEEAEGQLASIRDSETKAIHAFELVKQGLESEVKVANKELAESKTGISTASEKKATAEGELAASSKELAADTTSLSELHHECMAKAEDFETETKSRGEELNALAAAKKVLQESTGGASTISYSSMSQVSLMQITSRAGLRQFEALHALRDLARKQHSSELSMLATRVNSALRATADPFGKVKGLIEDMISKLESDADADATKKAYCDKELSETNAKKSEKTADIEKMTTSIDKMSSQSAKLKEEVAALHKSLSSLTASQAEMDKIRAEEKELFEKNQAELSQGVEGVKLALKALRDYYAKGEGTGGEESSGIIGMLEVVESDFTKNLAEMTAEEDTAAAAYKTETKENAIEKATKEQDVKYKTKESADLDTTVAETNSDRASEQTQLDAVLEYLSKIEAECIAKAETFEERQARFTAEIAGCKEALKILEQETAVSLVQQRATRFLRGVHPHEA